MTSGAVFRHRPAIALLLGGGTSDDPLWRLLHLSSHLFIVGLPSAWLARALKP